MTEAEGEWREYVGVVLVEGKMAYSREARDLVITEMSTTARTHKEPYPGPKMKKPVATETRFSLRLAYLMWLLVLFEPEWWLASFGMGPLRRLGFILFPIVAGVVLLKGDRRSVHWPLLSWVAFHAMWVVFPFATNRGYALNSFKIQLLFYVFLIALPAAGIKDARRALPMVSIYLMQFGWWALHGLPGGRVRWHPTLGNEDGYGPMVVVGLAFASYLVLGARSRHIRLTALLVAVSCAVGLVASFTRGAVLAGALVLVVVWLRSPRKVATLGLVVLALSIMVIAGNMLFPEGAYWQRLQSISNGFEDPTGEDRRDLWLAGWRAFLGSPVFGVGPANFGAYAAENFGFGDAAGFYVDPAHLYGRNLHNIYFQLFAEQGLVGVIIFLSILIDFVARNRQLRTRRAIEYWEAATGGHIGLRFIALGLETGLLGYLASGFFYDQLYMSSLYALLAVNLLLHSVVVRNGSAGGAVAPTMAEKFQRIGPSRAKAPSRA